MLNVPQVLGQLIAIKYLSELPMKITVISMTLLAALVSVLLPIFVRTDINVALTLAAMGYFGIFMAIINSAMVGYISSIQNPKAMSVYMLGCSTNSLIVLVIQIICLAVFTDMYWVQSFLYFGSTGVILVVTCLCLH